MSDSDDFGSPDAGRLGGSGGASPFVVGQSPVRQYESSEDEHKRGPASTPSTVIDTSVEVSGEGGGKTADLSEIDKLMAHLEELKEQGKEIRDHYNFSISNSSLGSAADESSDCGAAFDSAVGHESGGWRSDMSEQSVDGESASTAGDGAGASSMAGDMSKQSGGGAGALSMAGDISEQSPDEADEVDEVDPRIKQLKQEVERLQIESGLRQVQLNKLQHQRQEQLLNEEYYKEQLETYKKALEEYELDAKARARQLRHGRGQNSKKFDGFVTLHPLGAPLIF